jgi:hypothetical protein
VGAEQVTLQVKTLDEALWDRVRATEAGCWELDKIPNKGGYQTLWRNGRAVYAHRLAYEAARGPIPPGLVIDHLCANRGCVNPEHLEPVTDPENRHRARPITTHCLRGHSYDEANTRWGPTGRRVCRACHRIAVRAAKAAKRRRSA